MDYLLDDLIDYTMEKVAAEELDGKERYEQEMGKARKRQIAGRVLTGTGLGVGVANIGMFGRDAMKIGKQYGTDAISQMNPEYQAAAMAAGKKFYKRGLAGQGVFAAGLGTGAFDNTQCTSVHEPCRAGSTPRVAGHASSPWGACCRRGGRGFARDIPSGYGSTSGNKSPAGDR